MTVEELLAVAAAQRLIARYAQLVDLNDGDGLAGLFTEDGRLDGVGGGQAIAGRDAIRSFFAERERQRDPSLPRRRHHVASIDAWLDGDELRARSYFNVIGPGGQIAGTYEDEFARDVDGWLFSRRLVGVEHRT